MHIRLIPHLGWIQCFSRWFSDLLQVSFVIINNICVMFLLRVIIFPIYVSNFFPHFTCYIQNIPTDTLCYPFL